jgi:hypothetical protein
MYSIFFCGKAQSITRFSVLEKPMHSLYCFVGNSFIPHTFSVKRRSHSFYCLCEKAHSFLLLLVWKGAFIPSIACVKRRIHSFYCFCEKAHSFLGRNILYSTVYFLWESTFNHYIFLMEKRIHSYIFCGTAHSFLMYLCEKGIHSFYFFWAKRRILSLV